MSFEATVDYLNFLNRLRHEWAERAQAVTLTAFTRGTPFTADEKATLELAFQKLQSFDELIPRQREIVERYLDKEQQAERQRVQHQKALEKQKQQQWEQESARRLKETQDGAAAARKVREDLERERAEQEAARQSRPETSNQKGIWFTRTVTPRDDEVTVPVAEVDDLPDRDNAHFLASQVERQAATLISWGYKSLGVRHYSRRYEGYRRAAYG